mmetsp:Transcript_21379/g.39148  ORF Transcript_21379/g.39148 Transcript_21379/m.39148 type:complete len:427 (-) Transcript_21379:96-1376(-)
MSTMVCTTAAPISFHIDEMCPVLPSLVLDIPSRSPLGRFHGCTEVHQGCFGGKQKLHAGAEATAMCLFPSLLLPCPLAESATEGVVVDVDTASSKEKLGSNIFIDTAKAKLAPESPAQTQRVLQEQADVHQGFRFLSPPADIADLYELGEPLTGANCRGEVRAATRRSDGCEVVVKVRAKRAKWTATEIAWKAVMSQMQKMGGNGHVLDILDLLEDPKAFYIVMPKCNGGELYEFLVTEAEVPEVECKRIVRQILTAVGHLHKNNLIHRDIKPENIMFDTDDSTPSPNRKVKLIDFDTCLEWSPTTPKTRRFAGTPGYIAPEALLGQAMPQSDLFSVGVILYILMTGETPWTEVISLEEGIVGSRCAMRMYNTLKAQVAQSKWDESPWTEFPLARELCQKLMAFDPKQRPVSVEEALAHAWLLEEE